MKKLNRVYSANPKRGRKPALMVLALFMIAVSLSARAYEEEIVLERWMVTPFEVESNNLDSELLLEDWMSAPFEIENRVIEAEVYLEEWMIAPFNIEEIIPEPELVIEVWMRTNWL